MASFSFKEINFQKSSRYRTRNVKNQDHFLDICLYNYYNNKITLLIDSIFENLPSENFNYRLTVLELSEGLEPTDVSLFVSNYPEVRLFLPAKDLSIEQAINLYVKESKANYILMLSGEFERLEIKMDVISHAFGDNASLLGAVPQIMQDKKPIESVYGLNIFKKKLFLSYDIFGADQLSIKPYKMNFFFDRDRYLALGGLNYDWGSFFLSNLDLGYRVYGNGHQIRTCDQFVLHSSEKSKDNYLSDFKPIYGNLEFALRCFKIKHFKAIFLPFSLLSLLFFSGWGFNFRWVNKVGRWLRYRNSIKESLKTEWEVMSLFK